MSFIVGDKLYDDAARVKLFVQKLVPDVVFSDNDPAIGFLKNGELVGGVVYNNFRGNDISSTFALTNPIFLRKIENINAMFSYPFEQLGVARITNYVRKDNLKSIKITKHFGFKKEGVLRQGAKDGSDILVFGLLRKECAYIAENAEKFKKKRLKNG